MFNNMFNEVYASAEDQVIDMSHRFALERRLDFEWFGDINMFDDRRYIRLRFSRTPRAGIVKDFIFYTGDNPHNFLLVNLENNLDEWISGFADETKTQSYRDQLVEQIKAAGQDLIDRAESFVASDLDTIGGFRIEIDIPQDGPVEIVTRMNTYCKSDKYYMTSAKGE